MPVQAAQWTEFLSCPICYNEFDGSGHKPISLGCSHTVCKTCLHKLHRKACPFDQTAISTDIDLLPVNRALLQLVGAQVPDGPAVSLGSPVDSEHYEVSRACVEELALYLKPISGGVATLSPSALSRPMQRKLVTLVNCQLVEEEGRIRAVRAGRSLGERAVTELILQHQNPQQLSANLWAAVRARGCQFLGPAMQEDALKLVLLALEDGSALSRKVLVLFVVQKLEARFPQASKTSIGHVVQLLYRASCFKVTKRDEDSSLMQLKEEFRTYEALRREHDAQIVHIAMEAGLRISPEQWSSLLYGDLVHKSHMQSIIDKLQSPESFAKSVQELTIVLQRTGDPANLNSLRLHLELLANIDHNTDAAPPTWEELQSVMLAVKVVVHGLVEFIQNFSKKSHETPQPQPNSKYKTSMCRDLRQQGGCPRGANCTFAHTQDELEKYRMRNKKLGGASRPFLLSQGGMGKGPSCKGGISVMESSLGGLKGPEKDIQAPDGPLPPQLIPRGGDSLEDLKRVLPNGANVHSQSTSVNIEQKTVSPPKTPVSQTQALLLSPHATAHETGGGTSSKPAHFLLRGHPELYYQDQRSPTCDVPPYQPASNYYPPTGPPSKPCVARFLRSVNVAESSFPPASPYADQQSLLATRDRLGPQFGQQQAAACSSLSPGHGHGHGHAHSVYAPVYDSRRTWRPQLYQREDGRSNSLPPEVLHSPACQPPPTRERYNSLDSPYCGSADHRAALHRTHRPAVCSQDSYSRVPLGYEDLLHRKQEQWAHHHGNVSRPSQSSPVFAVDFCAEHADGVGGACVSCKYRAEESLAHYSPWSCGSISPFDSEQYASSTYSSCSQHMMDFKIQEEEVESGGGKRWLHMFEPYRRLKEEDPIIPFGEGPIISKWGAISRASRTGYHTTDPVQATASQGGVSTTPINFRDYSPHIGHGDYRWGPRGSDSSSHSSFLESDQLGVMELQARRPSLIGGEKLEGGRFHPEASPNCAESEPDRDIELELSALDLEDNELHQNTIQEPLEVRVPAHSALLSPPSTEPQKRSPDGMDHHLLKKMAFRKALSPGGLGSGRLGIGKLTMKTGPPTLADSHRPSTAGPEVLLNGS
ncbi:roquin-2 isoform X2 [Clupea harengus]|uniref:RING-type E3 ubiquitin transferase n=1 Tax=Clupea harengus TaxID=7950 RepID=A0A6P8G1S6_CLUHA|nr:roquin-2 isoform X2 [Clupea harengus]